MNATAVTVNVTLMCVYMCALQYNNKLATVIVKITKLTNNVTTCD